MAAGSRVDGHTVRNPSQLADLIKVSDPSRFARVRIYRLDELPELRIPRGRLLTGSTAQEQLGISRWSIGRDWRATGFYSHYVTYAESLQLIGSLALGLLICCPLYSKFSWLLSLAVAGCTLAMILTMTRATWIGFLAATAVMMLVGTSRRTLLLALACVVPLALTGILLLHEKRHVGLVDQSDASTTWRETVWREGVALLFS